MLQTAELISSNEAAVSSRSSIIPGTTVVENGHRQPTSTAEDEPSSRPGPVINDRPTTITQISPEALKRSSFAPSMVEKINGAFDVGHRRSGIIPVSVKRLSSIDNVYEEIGNAPDTVTIIIHYTGTSEIVGTCTAWRFDNTKVLVAVDAVDDADAKARAKQSKTFKRLDPLGDNIEAWEIKMLAVDIAAQGQGLATMLMDLCFEEAQRRFVARQQNRADGEVAEKQLLYVLTCVREINGPFYRKLGFEETSHTKHPVGTMGSPTGFTIAHMEKKPVLA